MFRILAKIIPCQKSPNKTKGLKESSPSSKQADSSRKHMGSTICELPADNAVGQTSLFVSAEITHGDEWLGQKYIECALAHTLLRRTSGSIGVTSLNGRLIQELADFRYDKCYEQLGSSGIRKYQWTEVGHFQGPVNFREAVLGWIGATLRRGNQEERAVFDRAIIINSSHQHRHIATNSIGSYNTVPQTIVSGPRETPGEESPSEDSETEIWRYTTTLQERFLGSDVVPIYNESTIRGYPPRFRAEVEHRGQMFFGEAGNKKLAKHRASKRLCESLDIKLTEQ